MKLYKTKFIDDAAEDTNTDHMAEWDGTQADAGKTRKRLKGEMMRSIETEDVEVPTSKQGLLEFLNQWCTQL
jgi:hypothetical protein